ncbi:MAG: peroxiredoxin family protein [Candidatus Bipolaricaulaceae bacterium]
MSDQWVVGVVVVALLLGLLLAPRREGLPGEGQFPIVGQPAPPFALRGLSDSWRLADHRGQPLVIAFWTTWCGACVKDLDVLESFHRQCRGSVQVVGVCPERWPDVAEIAAAQRISFPLLYDPGAAVTARYQLTDHLRYPFTVFVDGSGRVVGVWAVALRDVDHLRQLLARTSLLPAE